MISPEETIAKYYLGYFNRAGDLEGTRYWISKLNEGMSLLEVAVGFARAEEAQTLYPALRDMNQVDGSSFIASVYRNLFGREAAETEKEYWVGRLNSDFDIGRAIIDIIFSAQGTDADIIANKAHVGANWTHWLDAPPELDAEILPITNSAEILRAVTKTDQSIYEAFVEIMGSFRSPNPDDPDGKLPMPNEGPVAVLVTANIKEVYETVPSGTLGHVIVIDDGQGTNTLTLTGADASNFKLVGNAVQFADGFSPDFESGKTNYSFTVTAEDASTGDAPVTSVAYSVDIANVDEVIATNDFKVLKAPEFLVNDIFDEGERQQRIVDLGNDTYKIYWRDGNGVKYMRVIYADGTREEQQFSDVANLNDIPVSKTATHAGTGNTILIDDASANDIASFFTPFGGAAVPITLNPVTQNGQGTGQIVATTDGFLATWRSFDATLGDKIGSGIKAAFFDANGNPIGTERFFYENDGNELINIADLLANDSDPEKAGALKMTAIDATSSLGATLVLNDTNTDGIFDEIQYDLGNVASLDAGEYGTDTFRYTVEDATGVSSTALVTISVIGVI